MGKWLLQMVLHVFQKELRQKYGLIATGKVLPMEYYEGLHERVMKNSFNVEFVQSLDKCSQCRFVVS